jgi:hypothetical protein
MAIMIAATVPTGSRAVGALPVQLQQARARNNSL